MNHKFSPRILKAAADLKAAREREAKHRADALRRDRLAAQTLPVSACGGAYPAGWLAVFRFSADYHGDAIDYGRVGG